MSPSDVATAILAVFLAGIVLSLFGAAVVEAIKGNPVFLRVMLWMIAGIIIGCGFLYLALVIETNSWIISW